MQSEILTYVIPALLALVSAVTVCVINNHYSWKKAKSEYEAHMTEVNAQNQQTVAIIQIKLDELEKKVDRHNNVQERTAKLEGLAMLFDERLKQIDKNVEKLSAIR